MIKMINKTLKEKNAILKKLQIYSCLKCDGYKNKCDYYTPIEKDILVPNICLWYKIIENDLYKIKNNNKCLTFPLLEELIQYKKT